jgi:hypothetical protein
MRAFVRLAVVASVLCLAPAGCGGSDSGDPGNGGTSGGGSETNGGVWAPNEGGGGAPVLRAAGTVASGTQALASGLTTACEDPWTIRMLTYHPDPKVPRGMYVASCTPPGGKAKLFSSVSVKGTEGVSGAVFEAELDSASGALTPVGVGRQFPECREMHGIAAKNDCSVVGVLCRRATGASTAERPTKDMVAALPESGEGGHKWWITQPGSPEQGKQRNDEEWLYEWADGNTTKSPSTYVAHKAIGGWEYGSQALVYGQSDNTYGLSLKATVYGGGAWHEGDALLVVDRSSYAIDEKRGWFWGCAAGHTIFNHSTFNPATSQYAVTCGTDLGVDAKNAGGFGGIWTHTEGGKAQGYQSVPLYKSLSIGGGPTSLLPLADGGFVGVFAGVNGAFSPNQEFSAAGPITSIGFARFDRNGALVGNVKPIASVPGVFLSFPQLAPLGKGAYLLGYAQMAGLAERDALKFAYPDALRIPASYHLLEVDENGNRLTDTQTVSGAGWGEQDQMVPLGEGRVGWTYTPNPVRVGSNLPACASNQLALNVYTQK